MTRTSYLDSVALAIGWDVADIENQSLATAGSLTSATDAASIALLATELAFLFASEANWPDSTNWPAASAGDPYKLVLSVSAIGADLSLLGGGVTDSRLVRVSADLSTVEEYITGSWDSTTGTGLKTWTNTSANPGGAATSRAGFEVRVANAASMKAETITLNLGTTATYMQGPWLIPITPALLGTAAANPAPVVSVPPAQTVTVGGVAGKATAVIAGQWMSSPQGETFNAVAYGNGYWVAVGNAGMLYYKTTPDGAWTANPQGSANLNAVAYGNGYWVAVGSGSGTLYYKATDPTGAWTSNPQGSGAFNAVAYGNGYWVAVGTLGRLYYKATDPSGAWTSNTHGSGFNAVAYDNGYWVAVGSSGTLYYKATDPTGAWTSNAQGTATLYAVAYGNGYWVVVGASGTLYYKATDPTGAWTSNAQGSNSFNGVIYGNGYWVAVGQFNTLRYDAVPSTGTWAQNDQLGTWYDITSDGTTWVAVGGPAVLIYSAVPLPPGLEASQASGQSQTVTVTAVLDATALNYRVE